MNDWLFQNHGLKCVSISLKSQYLGSCIYSGAHYMLVGKSPRGNFNHCVVALGGEIVHDPHPSRAGLLDYQYMEFLVKA